MQTYRNILVSALLFPLCAVAISLPAVAQEAPLSYIASPDVYKLVAENSQFRVIIATWKAGQSDMQHSHSQSAVYRLTDCRAQVVGPSGKVLGESEVKAGSVVLQDAIPSHSFKNTGTTDCQVLIVERK